MTDESPTGPALSALPARPPRRRRPAGGQAPEGTFTAAPSTVLSAAPSAIPSAVPSVIPAATPSRAPSVVPAATPSGAPSTVPATSSADPSAAPSARTNRLALAGLLLLGVVPLIAGAARLTELTGGAEVTPENARFFAAPLPVVLHIVGVSVYSVLGVFQFATRLRTRRPGWHRVAGRVLVPSGLVAALTGLWMTLSYSPAPEGSGLLSAIRLVFGTAMVAAIVLGVAAIRRRDVARHRAWMIRGYAIGLGAGTQVLTFMPWFLIAGTPGRVATALLMAAGWLINVVVAELIIRGRTRVRRVS